MVPVIARLFGPKDYGIFQVGMSVCALLSVAGSLAIESSIAVSKSRKEAVLRTFGTSSIGLLSGILFCVGLYLIRPYLVRLYSTEIANAIILMSVIIIPLQIASVSLRNFVGYLGRFGFFAISDTLSVMTNFIVLVCSYLVFWKDYHSLILAAIVTLVVQVVVFLYAIGDRRRFFRLIRLGTVAKEMWRVRNFAKFYLPANFLNSASTQLPATLLALVFPANVVGLFAMATRVIDLPAALTGRALGQVFYPTAAKEYLEKKELTRITWDTFIYSCKLALFPVFLLAASSGFVLPVLFGAKWHGIGPYVVLLLPMVVLRAVETPIGIGFIFGILAQQHKVLVGNIVLAMCKVLPLVATLQLASSPYMAVFSYSMGGAIGYGGLLVWIFTSVSIPVTKAFYAWSRYVLLAVLCILPIFLTILNRNVFSLFAFLLISVAIYGLVAWFKFLNEKQRSSIKFSVQNWIKG
jgi:O-antigen/teichoic acid export membrane protein